MKKLSVKQAMIVGASVLTLATTTLMYRNAHQSERAFEQYVSTVKDGNAHPTPQDAGYVLFALQKENKQTEKGYVPLETISGMGIETQNEKSYAYIALTTGTLPCKEYQSKAICGTEESILLAAKLIQSQQSQQNLAQKGTLDQLLIKSKHAFSGMLEGWSR